MTSRKAKSNTEEIDNQTPPSRPPLHSSDQWVSVGTGNHYKGKWNHRTMSGYGVYVMLDGTIYNGNFDDGLFHGTGTVYYTSGSRIEGVWEKGKCIERNYIFSDGLRFQPDNWQYCEMPDRRYVIEHVKGLQPAAKSWITNRQPTIEVPDDAYDAGDGFYKPLTNTVQSYWTNNLIRVPTVEGGKWITENCRRGGGVRVAGFRPELHENWYGAEKETVSPGTGDPPTITDIKTVSSIAIDLLSLKNVRIGRGTPSFTSCQQNYCKKTMLSGRDERPSSPSDDDEEEMMSVNR